MLEHVEIHIASTAEDAARLGAAGLPRLDLEPTNCGNCTAPCGEVFLDGAVSWNRCGVLLDGQTLTFLCGDCLEPIDKARARR